MPFSFSLPLRSWEHALFLRLCCLLFPGAMYAQSQATIPIAIPQYGCEENATLLSISFLENIEVDIDSRTEAVHPEYSLEDGRIQHNNYLSPYQPEQIYPICYNQYQNIQAEVVIESQKHANQRVSVTATDAGDPQLPAGYSIQSTLDVGELQGELDCDAAGLCTGIVTSDENVSEINPMPMGKYLKRWEWSINGELLTTTQQRVYVIYSSATDAPMDVPYARILELALDQVPERSPGIQHLLGNIRHTLYTSSWHTSGQPMVFSPKPAARLRFDVDYSRTRFNETTQNLDFDLQDLLDDMLLSARFSDQWNMNSADFAVMSTLMARSLGMRWVYPMAFIPAPNPGQPGYIQSRPVLGANHTEFTTHKWRYHVVAAHNNQQFVHNSTSWIVDASNGLAGENTLSPVRSPDYILSYFCVPDYELDAYEIELVNGSLSSPHPQISSISPSSLQTDSETRIVIDGTNLQSSDVLFIARRGCSEITVEDEGIIFTEVSTTNTSRIVDISVPGDFVIHPGQYFLHTYRSSPLDPFSPISFVPIDIIENPLRGPQSVSELSPNPAQSHITLSLLGGSKDNLELAIFDLTGKEVKRLVQSISEDGSLIVDVQGLKRGAYIIRSISSKVSFSAKFLVE